MKTQSMTLLGVITLSAAACQAQPVQPAAEAEAPASNPFRCRIYPPDPSSSRVVQHSEPADFTSDRGHHYQIVDDYEANPDPSSRITINEKDRITLTMAADKRIMLSHTRWIATMGARVEVGSARLAVDSSGYWARGEARTCSTCAPVGEYVIFRLFDRGHAHSTHSTCRHEQLNGPGTTCKVMHFEYFDDIVPGHDSHKPDLLTNVLAPSAGKCPEKSQSDEGDGDHGPNGPN